MMNIIKLTILVLSVAVIASAAQSKSRARQNFFCDDALNEQVKLEFDAAQKYLSLASYFSSDLVALDGFAKMYHHSWKEELGHGQKLIEYGLLRGAHVATPSVSAPNDVWSTKDVCQIVEMTLELEKKVNQNLLKVHKCADGEENNGQSDPQFQDFLEGEFLKEQVEAAKELADLLTRLERSTMHLKADGTKAPLCDGLGLHIINKELAAKYN